LLGRVHRIGAGDRMARPSAGIAPKQLSIGSVDFTQT
jgi:hypothetical protein